MWSVTKPAASIEVKSINALRVQVDNAIKLFITIKFVEFEGIDYKKAYYTANKLLSIKTQIPYLRR